MVAERMRLAWEEQKKVAEAYHVENKAKAATAAPEPAPTTEGKSPKLLDFGLMVYHQTFKLLDEAFGIYAGEEEEVFDDGEEEETRTKETARKLLEEMERELIRTGLLGEDDIKRIREKVLGRKTD